MATLVVNFPEVTEMAEGLRNVIGVKSPFASEQDERIHDYCPHILLTRKG